MCYVLLLQGYQRLYRMMKLLLFLVSIKIYCEILIFSMLRIFYSFEW